VHFFAHSAQLLSALTDFVVVRVVLLLLPSVTTPAPVLKLATIGVGLQFLFGVPVLTLLLGVHIVVGLATVVLPIVGVNALFPLVLFVTKRAPDSLEMEHVEISIFVHPLQHVH
jgi:hypothetical protein